MALPEDVPIFVMLARGGSEITPEQVVARLRALTDRNDEEVSE